MFSYFYDLTSCEIAVPSAGGISFLGIPTPRNPIVVYVTIGHLNVDNELEYNFFEVWRQGHCV